MNFLNLTAICIAAILLEVVECRNIQADETPYAPADLILQKLLPHMTVENVRSVLPMLGCDEDGSELIVNEWAQCLNFTLELIALEEIGVKWNNYRHSMSELVHHIHGNFTSCKETTGLGKINCVAESVVKVIPDIQTALKTTIDLTKTSGGLVLQMEQDLVHCFHKNQIPALISQKCESNFELIKFLTNLSNY